MEELLPCVPKGLIKTRKELSKRWSAALEEAHSLVVIPGNKVVTLKRGKTINVRMDVTRVAKSGRIVTGARTRRGERSASRSSETTTNTIATCVLFVPLHAHVPHRCVVLLLVPAPRVLSSQQSIFESTAPSLPRTWRNDAPALRLQAQTRASAQITHV